MSRDATSFVLGYHGCDEEIGRRAVAEGFALEQSRRDYDWLGPGVYFWESDPVRAMEWAREKVRRGDIKSPFVVGAVIDLRNCLDLLVRENIHWLTVAYEAFVKLQEEGNLPIPENRDNRTLDKGDKILRFLDCAVIKHLHTTIESEDFARSGEKPF